MTSILARIRDQQRAAGRIPDLVPREARVGIALSSKDRCDFTRQVLASLEASGGKYELIWIDGSDSPEGIALARDHRLANVTVVERHLHVTGGPDAAIRYALARLIELRYDYVGLLENDIVLQPHWFQRLMQLFDLATADGVAAGAASIRGFTDRVLEFEHGYSLNWNIGAGMIMFTREGAEIVLGAYDRTRFTAREVRRYFGELLGVDLRASWELWLGRPDRRLSPDWGYDIMLYRRGLASVAAVPNLARDLEYDPGKDRWTAYVSQESTGAGCPWPPFGIRQRVTMRLSDPLYSLWWLVVRFIPGILSPGRRFYFWLTRRRLPPMAQA